MLSFPPLRAALIAGALLISAGAANAQDAPVSKIAVLLPPARELGGLRLQITDAGFSAPQDIGISNVDSSTSGFYFSYRVEGNEDKERKAIAGSYAPVVFNGLFAPDGAPIVAGAGINQTQIFSAVQPRWNHVRAEFEVRGPLASDEQTGSIVTRKEFDSVDLPAPGQTNKPAEPIEFTTPNGTRLQLIEVTRPADSTFLKALWRLTPLAESNVEVELRGRKAFYKNETQEKKDTSTATSPEGLKGDYTVQTDGVAGQKSVSYSFDIIETSRAWRKAGALELVSIDIPSNAIWKRAPLPLRAPALPSVTARNEDFEATWENISWSKYNGLFAQVWLRDLAPLAAGEHWTLKNVEAGDAATPPQPRYSEEYQRNAFHTDNKPGTAEESNTAFRLPLRLNLPPRGDVTLQVRRARTLLTTHVLQNVPLPARDGMLEFERGQFFDGSWHLRRVLLLEDKQLRARLQNREAAMLLTFDVDPANYDAQSDMEQWGARNFYDEKGALQIGSYLSFIKGDPMEAGREKDRVTMVFPLPAVGTQKFGGNFQVFQRVWSGPTKTLVLSDVPLKAQSKEPARD